MMTKTGGTAQDIFQTLGLDPSSARSKRQKRWFIAAALLAGAAISVVIWRAASTDNQTQYKTETVRSGDLTITVTATGTLQPTNQVDVGSELSGLIKTVSADYNDRVKAGQALATLNTDLLKSKVVQSQATLDSADAKLLESRATVAEAKNQMARLKEVWEKSNKKVPSQHELDSAEATLQRALASEAGIKAQIAEARATLKSNRTNLAKAVIRSPIKGIIIKRAVEPGQTVTASFQSPVLFTVAENLAQMELRVDVDEADVGQVKKGQEALFTVDAYPNRTFPGRIRQVRYGPKTVEGVVTYETVLIVDNSGMFLRPGMTATAVITVKKIEHAVLVPSAALRFTPPAQQDAGAAGSGLVGNLLPQPPQSTKPAANEASAKNQQQVWTIANGRLAAIPISTGAANGKMTEVVSGDVKPGMEVVVDIVEKGK